VLQRVLDLLWPRRCEVCGRPCDRPRRYICADCLNRIPFVRPEDGVYEIADAASAVRFECETREMVHGFKFRRRLWLRDDFVDWMEAAARVRFDVAAVDVVVPMPTTLRHRMDRGYNQCEVLASELARRIGRRCLRLVARRGSFRQQSTLSEEDRVKNVKGTFSVRRPALVRGRTVLVVDDIMTTGATLGACAAALREAGASRVWSVTLARSVRN